MNEAQLLDEIAEAPDEVGPYLICADLLQQRGDPRGDLIVVQHALETAGEDVALRRREGELLRGMGPHPANLVVRWKRGFVHGVRLLEGSDERTLASVLAIPYAESTLAELRLDGDDLPSILELLGRRWPRALRRLYIADESEAPAYSLAAIAEVAGRLDTLVLGGQAAELGRAPRFTETLRHLDVRTRDAVQLAHVARWPVLEHLGTSPDALPLLTIARFPRLRSLAMRGAERTGPLCAAIAALDIAANLEALDVSNGDLVSGRELDLLPPRIALDVRRNLLPPAAVEPLAARGALVRPQRDGARPLDGDTRARLEAELAAEVAAVDGEPRAAYDRIVELAERCDGASLFDGWRTRFVRRLPPAEACSELLAIAAARARRLVHVDAVSIGEVLHELGDQTRAEAWLVRAITEARLRGDPAGEGRAMVALGKVERTRANDAAAEASLRVALELARKAENGDAVGDALSELAGLARDRGELAGAEELLRTAIETRPSAADQLELAAVLLDAGHLPAARDEAVEAYRTLRDDDDLAGMARSQGLVGEIIRSFGDNMLEARKWLDASLALARAQRSALAESAAQLYLARLTNDLGHHLAARAHAQQATHAAHAGVQQLALADAALGEKQYAEAQRCADRAIGAFRASHGRARARLRKGIAVQLEGGDARAILEDAGREAGDHDDALAWIELWLAACHGRAYRAKQAAELLEAASERFPTRTHRTRDALVMVDALLRSRGGTLGDVRDAVPGYMMAVAIMDRAQGYRVTLRAPTTFDTRLLVRLGEA